VLPFGSAVVAYDRGILPQGTKYTLDYIRRQNNIPTELAEVYAKLNRWYPSLSDLNIWLMRSVYNDEVARRYSLDEDLPNTDVAGMGRGYEPYYKLGLDHEFAKYEWRATWKMPSFYEARYMYNWYLGNKDTNEVRMNQKLHFDENAFDYAMKVANWPPYFRRLLHKITSLPPTRVMIQRFYQAQIIKDNDLPALFDWAGYHGKINDLLVEFTKKVYSTGHKKTIKQATASVLQKLYTNGKISKTDYETHMKTLGYTPETLKLYEAYIAINEKLQYEKIAMGYIKAAYMRDELTDSNAMQAMLRVGVSNNIANEELLKWKTMKIKKRKYLSFSELVKMYDKKIMSGYEVYEYVRTLGYDETDAKRLCKLKGVKI